MKASANGKTADVLFMEKLQSMHGKSMEKYLLLRSKMNLMN